MHNVFHGFCIRISYLWLSNGIHKYDHIPVVAASPSSKGRVLEVVFGAYMLIIFFPSVFDCNIYVHVHVYFIHRIYLFHNIHACAIMYFESLKSVPCMDILDIYTYTILYIYLYENCVYFDSLLTNKTLFTQKAS